jgi:tRNA pseudouridine65 synthase
VSAGPELPILYRDEWLVVVDKPSGLLVHRSVVDARETRFAVHLLRDQLGQYVYPVHRLDKGTSGALAFALDADTARVLSRAFAGEEVEKSYVALVRGWPPESGEIDHALGAVKDDVLPAADGPPKDARTRYSRLATFELPHRVDRYPSSRYALVSLAPLTGRRHQLRRHLAHISHPIVGDSTYGRSAHNRLFERLYGVRRLMLACVRLAFAHPVTGTPLGIAAPIAPEFASVLEALGWEDEWPGSPAQPHENESTAEEP